MDRGQFENESLEIKNILNKFNHIGFLDYKEVKKALLINETITNKLDYLKEIKENYFDKYLTVFLSLNEKEQRFQSEILKSIFGNYELWSSLQIQEPIYDEFFRDLENQDTEYQYWFMRFSAEEKFKAKLNSEDYKDMIASSRSEKYIKAELKEINDTIEEVDTLKHRTVRDNKKGDDFIFDWEKSAEDQVSKWCFTDKETELIQIARILDLSYYKENIAKSNIDNLQAEIYFKYILYKEHLERLVKTDSNNEKNLEVKNKENEINIFCAKMELNIPKNHFKRLTTNNSENGKPFLTEKQLDNFIQKEFLGKGKDLLKDKINLIPKGEKLKVQSIFYEFYDIYCFEYFNTNQNQDHFIKVLTNNFVGWDFEKLKGNFKPKTKKRLV